MNKSHYGHRRCVDVASLERFAAELERVANIAEELQFLVAEVKRLGWHLTDLVPGPKWPEYRVNTRKARRKKGQRGK